jgi:preprotein translocase subunit YajC
MSDVHLNPYSSESELVIATAGQPALRCPNCNLALRPTDKFCADCGQQNKDLRVPFAEFLLDVIDTLFHITSFQGKFWQTFRLIFARPGQLTADYLAGKRARHVAPMRLYLWISLFFFLLINQLADQNKVGENFGSGIQAGWQVTSFSTMIGDDRLLATRKLRQMADLTIEIADSDTDISAQLRRLKILTNSQLDSLLKRERQAVTPKNRADLRQVLTLLPAQYKPTYTFSINKQKITFESHAEMNAFFRRISSSSDSQIDSLMAHYGGQTTMVKRWGLRAIAQLYRLGNDDSLYKDIAHTFLKNVSTLMFLLMPVVALLLWLLYARRKQHRRFYYEHLIFSLHFHTVLLLLLGLWVGAVLVFPALNDLSLVNWQFVVVWLYLLLAMKRVYQQGWPRTLLKCFLLTIGYLLTASLFMATAFIAGVMAT